MPFNWGCQMIGSELYGRSSLLVAGNDGTGLGGTSITHLWWQGDNVAANRKYLSHSQGAADADSSNPLAVRTLSTNNGSLTNAFTTYIETGVLCQWIVQARSPAGATISVAVYVNGIQATSPVTFSNTEFAMIDMGTYQHDLTSLLQDLSLTVRFWGGSAHVGAITVLPRPTRFDCATYLDTTDGAASVTDSLSWNTNVVKLKNTSHTMKKAVTIPNIGFDEPILFSILGRQDAGVSGSNWAPYTGTDGNAAMWINGTDISGAQWLQTVWLSPYHMQIPYQPIVFWQGTTVMESQVHSNGAGSAITVAATDTVEIRLVDIANPSNGHLLDVLFASKIVQDPTFTSTPGSSSIAPGNTFNLGFTHASSGLLDHYEGWLLDRNGHVITVTNPITSAWTVPSSTLPSATGYIAAVLAVYPDGSYGYKLYRFEITGGGPRLLPILGVGI